MKHQVLTTVLLAGGAGVVGAVVSNLFLASESAPREEVGRNDALLTSLERNMETLRSTNTDLLERIQQLEERPPVVVQSDRNPVLSPEVADSEIDDEELKALVASMQGTNAPVPENFVAVVGNALDEIRAQEEREREEARLQSTIDSTEQRLTELQTKLGLSNYQVDEMRPVLLDLSLARAKLMETARDSGDWATVRGEMREIQSSSTESLSQILTPEQLEEYEDSSRGFGRRGGGGGGDGAGGGTGGGGRRGRDG